MKPTLEEKQTCLQSCGLFHDLSGDEMETLLKGSTVAGFSAAAIICSQGDPASCAFIVMKGEAGIYIPDLAQPIHIMKGGDLFGEYGLFTGRRTAQVRALTDVVLIALDYRRLREHLFAHPQVMYDLLAVTVDRLQKTESFIKG